MEKIVTQAEHESKKAVTSDKLRKNLSFGTLLGAQAKNTMPTRSRLLSENTPQVIGTSLMAANREIEIQIEDLDCQSVTSENIAVNEQEELKEQSSFSALCKQQTKPVWSHINLRAE